jgi:hypothetical protein
VLLPDCSTYGVPCESFYKSTYQIISWTFSQKHPHEQKPYSDNWETARVIFNNKMFMYQLLHHCRLLKCAYWSCCKRNFLDRDSVPYKRGFVQNKHNLLNTIVIKYDSSCFPIVTVWLLFVWVFLTECSTYDLISGFVET